jgi:hypothetical protein
MIYGNGYKKVMITYKNKKRSVPETYVKGLKGDDLKKQIKSIFEGTSRPQDVKFKSKRSPWCEQFEDKYDHKITETEWIDKNLLKTKGQELIKNKGMKAYQTSGSRPKQNPYSWGYARLCSVLMDGPSRKIDKKEFNKYRVYNYKLDKVEEINDVRSHKRFRANFSDGDTVDFGLTNPKFGTFLDHKDKKRKENYNKRHTKDLDTDDPKRAGYLSMFILWNKETLKASVNDYNKRLKENDWSIPK